MGLDMYFSKKHYVKNWDHQTPEERHNVIVIKNGKEREDINKNKISYIEEEVFYWRKANAIHQWFVENIQDGDDDCREANIGDIDRLLPLKKACEETLELLKKTPTKKEQIHVGFDGKEKIYDTIDVYDIEENIPLATTSGFFFGGTQYDSYYKETIEKTLEMLNKEFAIKDNHASYYYSSSW